MREGRRRESARTRYAVLELLKLNGAMDSSSLAACLHLTPMAVRKQLYELQAEKLVDFKQEPRAMGRPAKLWALTPSADRLFPSGHADLVVDLIGTVRKAFGEEGLLKVIRERGRSQLEAYQARLQAIESLPDRVRALTAIRLEEGYMAELAEEGDGRYLLIENHCPICAAARTCQGFCDVELDLFRRVLGPAAEVDRTEHIQQGARRCVYRIRHKV
ncbi:MAG: transcriptional regulator [Planctomycetes bacterium]|nr:transcriptional regulator [Planctomycetota bacterium]